jgi:hypothetical protein
MLNSLASPPTFVGLELLAGSFTRVSHRDKDIFMGMVTLRVMTHNNINARQLKAHRHVKEISLMMVTMSALDDHRSPHN